METTQGEESPDKSGMSATLLFGFVLVTFCIIGVPLIALFQPALISLLKELRGENNVSYAVGSLRTINVSNGLYKEKSAGARYGNLRELAKAGLIAKDLGNGLRHGYRFEIGVPKSLTGPAKYWVKATPEDTRVNNLHFFTNEIGVIYFADKDFQVDKVKGAPTTKLRAISR
jgi:hypothetical protein